MLNRDQKSDFDALLPGTTTAAGASRRTALKAALGVGYAASVLPIAAQTAIKTSSDGLRTGQTSFEVNGFKVPAFYAAPEGKTTVRAPCPACQTGATSMSAPYRYWSCTA